jgi:predicted transcriptional regulator
LHVIRDSLIMGLMNVTITLDDELVREVRKIAAERDTTLTGMVREYLQALTADSALSGRKRRERQALERSFERFRFKLGRPAWNRADLHVRR